jgi:hypothetical protein
VAKVSTEGLSTRRSNGTSSVFELYLCVYLQLPQQQLELYCDGIFTHNKICL